MTLNNNGKHIHPEKIPGNQPNTVGTIKIIRQVFKEQIAN